MAGGASPGGLGVCEQRQAWELRVNGREAEIRARLFRACARGLGGPPYHPLLSGSVGIAASKMSSTEGETKPSESTNPRSLQRIHRKVMFVERMSKRSFPVSVGSTKNAEEAARTVLKLQSRGPGLEPGRRHCKAQLCPLPAMWSWAPLLLWFPVCESGHPLCWLSPRESRGRPQWAVGS